MGHVRGGMKHETTINFTLDLHFFTSLQFSLAMQKEHNPLLALSDMHQLHKHIFVLSIKLSDITLDVNQSKIQFIHDNKYIF